MTFIVSQGNRNFKKQIVPNRAYKLFAKQRKLSTKQKYNL